MKYIVGNGLPRGIEAALAMAALVIFAPLLFTVALLLSISHGPILFRHRRVGKDGLPFELVKFRTMRMVCGGPEVTKGGDPRITRLGHFLRRTKIDELPELWNVVRGDMSLVGPRPESLGYVVLSDPLWREVLRVRPGITDPVTLHLRNEEELLASVEDDYETFYRQRLLPCKLRACLEYQRSRNWRSDVVVLWSTVLGIILPRRATAGLPEKFSGLRNIHSRFPHRT